MFERKIASQNLPEEPVRAIEAPDEQRGSELVVGGGDTPVRFKDRGHRNAGQTILHHQEMRSQPLTLRFASLPNQNETDAFQIEPGIYGAYCIRTDLPALSLSVRATPAVPDDQHASDGGIRQRFWKVRVQIYYEQETALTFSGKMRTSEDGYTLTETGDPVVYSLDAVKVLSQPRPAGTSDLLEITYSERSGEAFVAFFGNFVSDDPVAQDPDATEDPEEEDDLFDPDGISIEDPNFEYVDEDGNPIPFMNPTGRRGALIALHDEGYLISTDSGRNWFSRELRGPSKIKDIAVARNKVLLLLEDGRVRFANTPGGQFQTIDLSRLFPPAAIDVLLENGDFEKGDLTGWTVATDSQVSVLDTDNPPQRPDSRYYLTRDLRSSDDFQVSRIVNVPANSGERPVLVSVDAFAGAGATGRLRVHALSETDGNGFALSYSQSVDQVSGSGGVGTVFESTSTSFRTQDGRGLKAIFTVSSTQNAQASAGQDGTSGPLNTRRLSGSAGFVTFDVEFFERDTGARYNGPIAFGFRLRSSFRGHDAVHFQDGVISSFESQSGITVANGTWSGGIEQGVRFSKNTNSDREVRLYFDSVPDSFKMMWAPNSTGFNTHELIAPHSNSDENWDMQRAPNFVPEGEVSQDFETQTSEEGRWQTLNLLVPGGPRKLYLVSLIGEGEIYFDNVAVSAKDQIPAAPKVTAIGSGNNSFLLTVTDSQNGNRVVQMDLSRQTRVLGDLSFQAKATSRQGEVVLAATDTTLAKSMDSGLSFDEQSVSQGQVMGVVANVFLIDDGGQYKRLVQARQNGFFEFIDLYEDAPALQSPLHLELDKRRKQYLITEQSGLLFGWNNGDAQLGGWGLPRQPLLPPVSGEGEQEIVQRGTLAMDNGRLIGWIVGRPSLFFWDQNDPQLDTIGDPEKGVTYFGIAGELQRRDDANGKLFAPIIKIVEFLA